MSDSGVVGIQDNLEHTHTHFVGSYTQTHFHSPLQGPGVVDIHQFVSVDEYIDAVALLQRLLLRW